MMRLVPYIQVNGAWTLPDDFMRHIYDLMHSEGTFKRVFHSGGVQNFDQFIAWMKSRLLNVLIIVSEKDSEPLAMAWISGFEDRRAWFNFCTFKRAWGKRSITLLKKAGDYWFGMKDNNGKRMIEILIGITPANNKLALAIINKCGVKRAGVIPGFFLDFWTKQRVDAVISYLQPESKGD